MLPRSLWVFAVIAVLGRGLLLMPGASEAHGGGGGGQNSGGHGGGGGGHNGGGHGGGGFHGGASYSGGFHGSGFYVNHGHYAAFPSGAFHGGNLQGVGSPALVFHGVGTPGVAFHNAGFHAGGGWHSGGRNNGSQHAFGRPGIRGGGLGLGYGIAYVDGSGWPSYGSGYYNSPGSYGDWYANGAYYGIPAVDYNTLPYDYNVGPTNLFPTALSIDDYTTYDSSVAYSQTTDINSAACTIRVPDPNAQIWFQDYLTQEQGTVRAFETSTLQPGTTYMYHIRARWIQNGQPVEQTRDVPVSAGQGVFVDFVGAPVQR